MSIFLSVSTVLLMVVSCSTAFLSQKVRPRNACFTSSIAASGQGFGQQASGDGNLRRSLQKTYDSRALQPRKDVMDADAAMRDFFEGTAESWKPLFRKMSVQSIEWLDGVDVSDFEFHATSQPWQRLEGIPTEESDRSVLANFLDQVQQSLVDIPVDETTEEDDFDLQFLEEGRRMLVCGRFHVIQKKNRMDHFESLFATCWNELFHLADAGEPDTGSVILVPDTELEDLRRFVDMNLQRPLQWMGLHSTFEVTSLERGSPAVRLIHKLGEIPTELPDAGETMSGSDED